MKKTIERLAALALCAALAGGLCGCQLAQPEGQTAADELIGLYVTAQPLDLFDIEGYLNDQLSDGFAGGELTVDAGDAAAYAGRLYAQPVAEGTGAGGGDFAFLDTPGWLLALWHGTAEDGGRYFTSLADDVFSEVATHQTVTDEGDQVDFSALMVAEINAGGGQFQLNPVYRTADGQVYLTQGNGYDMQNAESEGEIWSVTFAADTATTVNGQTSGDGFSLQLRMAAGYGAQTVTFAQFDGGHALLASSDYAANALPERFAPRADAAYLVIERHYTDAQGKACTARQLYDRAQWAAEGGLTVNVLVHGEAGLARQAAVTLAAN